MKETRRKDTLLPPAFGLRAAVFIALPFTLFVIFNHNVQLHSLEQKVLRVIEQKLAVQDADAPRDEEGTLSITACWQGFLDLLPDELLKLGMTERQMQISIGIVCQKNYERIAHEIRVDERTVRQHATYAFKKVGCHKRSEFLDALMDAIGVQSA